MQNAEAIKIGLQENINQTTIAASNGAEIINSKNGIALTKIAAMKPYKIKASGGNIYIFTGGKFYNLSTNSITVSINSGFTSVKKHWYRGNLLITAKGSTLTVINDVDLESYIRGVVPSEMPSKWELEALKAQAIAARSYALANTGKRGSHGYDLKDTPEDQAYNGASAETKKTNHAVDVTKGLVITYNKHIVPAYYHASSGGKTTNSGGIWNKDLPYLRSVPSFDSQLSKNGHGVGMSQHGANNLAKQGYNSFQILTYFYNNIHFGRLRPEWKL